MKIWETGIPWAEDRFFIYCFEFLITDLELSTELERISLEEPELEAEIKTELPRGPELTQLLPLTGQLPQRALHRAHRAWNKKTFKPRKKNCPCFMQTFRPIVKNNDKVIVYLKELSSEN